MSGASTPPSPGTPHLVSLVLHSKKALQHGEQLCTRADELTRTTARIAASLLALDAKARWVAKGILEQLKLAEDVKKTIELQRARLEEQAKQWDETRDFHAGNLDSVLESLQAQPVPPDFHQSPSESSIFGSQHPSDDDQNESEATTDAETPVLTRGRRSKADQKANERERDREDRRKWKTLRDFVHERGIEDETEKMDADRGMLDDILAVTEDFPAILEASISSLRNSLPVTEALPSLPAIFSEQDRITIGMATHLESLAKHYDEMAGALRDKESGEMFSEDDLQDMNRDTNELPGVIAELEDGYLTIQSNCDRLQSAQAVLREQLKIMREILGGLDELEEVMADMLVQQQNVEAEYEIHLAALQQHLQTLEHLYMTYTSYQSAYNTLLVELDRRRRYREAAEQRVHEMSRELEVMRDEEIQAREAFYATHGPHLPDDLCLCVANMPTKYEVATALGEVPEELPDIDEDLLTEAIKRVDLAKAGSESL